MKALYHSISNEIFSRYPGYLRGVVVASDVINGPPPDILVQHLRRAEAAARQQLTLENLIEDDHIRPWREAFRSFGAKPSEFRPSIEGLVRRSLRSDPLPSINALVDIGNIISLRHLLPVGGHGIEPLNQDMVLRFARGDETFIPFGSDQVEHPLPGEVIFSEGNIVLTRRWTWRQGTHTLTLPETRIIEINVDGLPPVTTAEIERACLDTIELVSTFCGGSSRFEILSQDHPQIKLTA
jgi:DNA/RNA-binding domain of Phe-tRNA-synthetase-like protein